MDRFLRRLLCCVLVVGGGGCGRAPDRDRPIPAGPDQVGDFDRSAARAESRPDPYGYLVSWDDGKTPPVAENLGDALFYTAAELASTPCTRGRELEGTIIAMMDKLNGGMWRHPTQADKISLDPAVMVYRAIARRVVRCGEGDTWRPVFAKHLAFLAAHPAIPRGGILELGWQYLPELLGAKLGLRDEPPAGDRTALEELVAGWAALVKLAHATGQGSDACFRVHVGLEALQTIEELGHPTGQGPRDAFCSNTAGMDLPTVNQWCGRAGLKEFLSSWRENEWQYRLQRCQWESADGDGWWQPGIDRVRGMADYFGL